MTAKYFRSSQVHNNEETPAELWPIRFLSKLSFCKLPLLIFFLSCIIWFNIKGSFEYENRMLFDFCKYMHEQIPVHCLMIWICPLWCILNEHMYHCYIKILGIKAMVHCMFACGPEAAASCTGRSESWHLGKPHRQNITFNVSKVAADWTLKTDVGIHGK